MCILFEKWCTFFKKLCILNIQNFVHYLKIGVCLIYKFFKFFEKVYALNKQNCIHFLKLCKLNVQSFVHCTLNLCILNIHNWKKKFVH